MKFRQAFRLTLDELDPWEDRSTFSIAAQVEHPVELLALSTQTTIVSEGGTDSKTQASNTAQVCS